jgi:hypothetical protein
MRIVETGQADKEITMKNQLIKILPLFLLAAGIGCVSPKPRPEPVTVPQVVEMSKAGVPAGEIIGKMKASGTIYRLQASQLVELHTQGVSPEVLDYMQQTFVEAIRRDAAYDNWNRWTPYDNYWYGGPPFGWPDRVIVVREHELPPPPPPTRPPKPARNRR